MHCLTIILPRSSKKDMARIHWYYVTPNFIKIFLLYRKWHQATLRYFHLTTLLEPIKFVGLWVILSGKLQLINHLLRDHIFTTSPINDQITKSSFNAVNCIKNIGSQPVFFKIEFRSKKSLPYHKFKPCSSLKSPSISLFEV